MVTTALRNLAMAVAMILLTAVTAAAQVATGTVSGTVKDNQGGVIPGATVALISATRGTSIETTTNIEGGFSFPNVTGDTYTVRMTMSGFTTLERRNVAVSPGDRVPVGVLTIQVGSLSETVTVAAEAPLIQAETGERSFTVSTQAIDNLPIAGRSWNALVGLTPGTSGTTRLGNPSLLNNNIMMNGVAIMDTGNNGQMLSTTVESVGEVKILPESYQAEYGRASGMQISAVTKAGTNRFTGSVYDVQRHSNWNENSWANIQNGIARAYSLQHDRGYAIGGPAGKPGGKNKLFFFYNHEYQPRTAGGGTTRFRVPTALERAGDFSQTTDNNGNLFPYIKDPQSTATCATTATGVHTGCFQDGGTLGKIPVNRVYGIGLNVLNLWPQPNATGLNFNYQNTAPTDARLTQQPTFRIDYQASQKLRVTFNYSGSMGTIRPTAGSIPGFNDTFNRYPFIYQPSFTVDYTLSPTMFIEGTYGIIQNQLGSPIISPASNRCNVGLCDIPLLFPDAGVMNPAYYNYEVLQDIQSPMLVKGRIMLPPTFSWGSRISNAPPSLIYPSFLNYNRTNNVSIAVTRLTGKHTLKAGFYWFSAFKAENLGNGIGLPFNGGLDFSNDSNNPLDTGFGFANAAVGVFSAFSQQSKFVEGENHYKNVEWYGQDNWKINRKLTLDYGLRFIHAQPQYDADLQDSNFFLDKWSLASAPQLYLPGCSAVVAPGTACPTASRVAVNPITGVSLGAGTAVAIATLVPNSGNVTQGLIQAGQGIAKENYVWPFLKVAPRIGAAYDLGGHQKLVLRGAFGMYYDRPEGNTTSSQIGNPPYSTGTTVRYATLQSLGSAGLITNSPATLTVEQYNSTPPVALQWNAGVQMTLPWSSALDVSYVGTHGYNLMNPFNAPLDINAPDFGAAFLLQNQDPTLVSTTPGAAALTTNALRAYRGYGAINMLLPRFYNTYHSIQMSFNRRFRSGLQFGLNYTLSLSQTGTNTLSSGNSVSLVHNPDGTYSDSPVSAKELDLMKDNGIRRHVIKGSFVWDLPKLKGATAAMRVVEQVVNDWQLSGILTAGSGAPYTVGFSYTSGGANVNLTGSPNYAARVVITGDPGSGCSSDQYKQFNTAAFSGPLPGSTGLESGQNYMIGCPDHTVDLALARYIAIGWGKRVQIRLDAFNAFNTVIWTARSSTVQMASPTNQTVANFQYNADGTINSARLLPTNAGFGAVSGSNAARTLQLQLRFQF